MAKMRQLRDLTHQKSKKLPYFDRTSPRCPLKNFFILPATLFCLCAAVPAPGDDGQNALTHYLRYGGPLPETVRQCEPSMVSAIEGLLLSPPEPTRKEYGAWVLKLGAAAPADREAASRALECAGPAVLPWILRDITSVDDPEVHERLQQAARRLQSWNEKLNGLRSALANAYAAHPESAWKERILELPAESDVDARAMLLIGTLSIDVLKHQLSLTPEKRRLEIILRIIFEHPSDELVQLSEDGADTGWTKELNAFKAADVLAACARLWPVELESLATQDGNYIEALKGKSEEEIIELTNQGASIFTWRAARAGNGKAENIIRLYFGSHNRRPCVVQTAIYRSASFDRIRMGPMTLWRGRSYYREYGDTWRSDHPAAWKYLPKE